MSKEEKRTLDFAKKYLEDDTGKYRFTNEDLRDLVNLIEKQEKVIDNMAIAIDVLSKPKGAFKSICLPTNNTEQIKKEFYREVENE